MIFQSISICILVLFSRSSCLQITLYVIGPHNSTEHVHPIYECDAASARFGGQFENNDEYLGCGIVTNPLSACTPLIKPNASDVCVSNFALVQRGNCSFAQKAYYVQKLPMFSRGIVIVINNESGVITMSDDGQHGAYVNLPVIMVSKSCGETILNNYSSSNGYRLVVQATNNYDLVKYLWPFVAVTGFCFIIMITAMIVKWVRDKRRQSRRRLSRRNLRKIPTKKYKKGEEPETCAICLDDFENGEKVRVLPCNHVYHCKCVDPWLTKNRKVCPVCKRKVLPGSADSSDSENDVESNATNSTEAAPLIPQTERGDEQIEDGQQIGNSTFYSTRYQSNGEGAPCAPPLQLSPPSSPEVGHSSSATNSIKGSHKSSPSMVVPGFVIQNAPLQRQEEGIENEAYEANKSDEDIMIGDNEYNIRRERRKRHAAPGANEMPHSLVSSSSDEETSESIVQPATVKNPNVLDNSTRPKKKRPRRKKRSVAASAPPNLPDRMESIDEEHKFGRQNSGHLDEVLANIQDSDLDGAGEDKKHVPL